jgi:hypothetical protein
LRKGLLEGAPSEAMRELEKQPIREIGGQFRRDETSLPVK